MIVTLGLEYNVTFFKHDEVNGFRVYKLYRTDRFTVHLSGLLWLAFQMGSRL